MRDVQRPRLHAVTAGMSKVVYRKILVLMCTQVTLKIRKINDHTLLLHITHLETDLHLHACQHSEETSTILSQLKGEIIATCYKYNWAKKHSTGSCLSLNAQTSKELVRLLTFFI